MKKEISAIDEYKAVLAIVQSFNGVITYYERSIENKSYSPISDNKNPTKVV